MQVRQKQLNLDMDDQHIRKKGDVRSLLFLLIRMVSVVKYGVSRVSSAYPQSVRDFSQPLDKWIITLRNKVSSRFWIAVILVGAITFVLRAVNLGRSFEVFIDEVTYLVISQSVARNLQVELYGHPFYLHPPAYFFMEAAFLKVFQPAVDTIHIIYATRFINVAIASITGVLLLLIARHARGWLSGIVVAVLFGLNPFVIKIASLNMLEASAIGFVIAGYWMLISAMQDSSVDSWSFWWVPGIIQKRFSKAPAKKKRSHKKGANSKGTKAATVAFVEEPLEYLSPWRLGFVGLFFGLALLVKESTAFLTLVPLIICFVLKWVIQRRDAVVIGLVSTLVYSIYPLIVFLNGDWALYSQQKFRGILRFLGVIHITGFNQEGAPSLTGTIINRLGMYGTTYLLIALGVIATVILLSNRGRIARLIGILVVSAYGMMVYLIFLGTLEEQFFIYLVVPCILACGVAIGSVKNSIVYERFGQRLLVLFICGSLLFTGWDTYQWINTHTRPDNGYEQVLAYLRKNVPGGEQVASISETGQHVLDGYQTGPWGLWHTVDELKDYKPEYLLVTPETVAWNYGSSADELLSWIETHGALTYAITGRQGNRMELYHLDWGKSK